MGKVRGNSGKQSSETKSQSAATNGTILPKAKTCVFLNPSSSDHFLAQTRALTSPEAKTNDYKSGLLLRQRVNTQLNYRGLHRNASKWERKQCRNVTNRGVGGCLMRRFCDRRAALETVQNTHCLLITTLLGLFGSSALQNYLPLSVWQTDQETINSAFSIYGPQKCTLSSEYLTENGKLQF